MKNLLLAFTLLLSSVAGFAATEDLIVSIEKTIPVTQVNKAIKDLLVVDASMGQCYFQTSVSVTSDYTKKPNEPYFAVVILRLEHNCAAARRTSYLKKLMKDKRYKLWSNPVVGGMPSVSGGRN